MTTLTNVSTGTGASAIVRRRPMLAVLLLGQFMGLLDVFVVNVAMPVIGVELPASGSSLQLVVGGYTAAYAMSLVTAARLGEIFGHRRMYLIGVIMFTAASLCCGLAPGSLALIASRIVQGAGAAVMAPQIMSIIQTRFEGPERARALSAYGVVLSIGAVAGLIAGGLLVNADLFGTGWRPAFLVNVPIGILLAVLVPRLVPADRPARRRGLDLLGLLIVAPAVFLVVLPLVLGRELGWPAWTFVAIGAGLVLAGLFAPVQRRVMARGGDPLLDLGVLRAPGLRAGVATLSAMQVTYGGFLFVFTLHLENRLGAGPLMAGLTYLPMSIAFGLVGFCWRRLPHRLHSMVTPAGLALCALAYSAIAIDGDHSGPLTWTALILTGVGMGLSASPLLTQSLRQVPHGQAADASGLLGTTMQLGQVIGVAAFGTLYLSHGNTTALPTSTLWMAIVSVAGVLAATRLARTLQS
ncbi:MFS transporter [Actinoallomurus iriomotensis]|uniref:MFS transporter n=1 Tax=Actinoallomurus iriomotensis TaxID=478107 RepID=A0A9W6RK59_9ACTN|nr:MFS transporter [Actinoallomurus iriomotensis]GLY77636.1 MFS transporter [Actinoallomurus iriomotensis]